MIACRKIINFYAFSFEKNYFINCFRKWLRIRIGFNGDLDPAFYLKTDSGGQSADPDPGHKKLKFYMKNLLTVGSRQKTYLRM